MQIKNTNMVDRKLYERGGGPFEYLAKKQNAGGRRHKRPDSARQAKCFS